jgi:hypothetical protein
MRENIEWENPSKQGKMERDAEETAARQQKLKQKLASDWGST